MLEPIFTQNAPAAIGPYSQAVRAGQFVFLSGVMPVDPATNQLVEPDITAQAQQIMKNIDALLRAAGCTAADVVKTTCFLSDIGNFAAFNAIYAEVFPSDPPARSCVEISALPKGGLVEMEVIARK